MADLRVENGTVITVNETGQIIDDGAVAVVDGEIARATSMVAN